MKYVLRLYVTGHTSTSRRAIENIQRICEERLKDNYDLQVIDILKNPRLAENEKIIVTPTLVRKLPAPLRKIIGDLSQTEKVLLGLDIVEMPERP